MTREEEMIRESQKRYDDVAFIDGVKWADEHPYWRPSTEHPQTAKQDIDWEQRRYEIAKEMLPIIYWQGMEAQKHGQSVKRKDTADLAVAFADVLIKKLKEKSE